MEAIDILSLLKVGNELVVKDDKAFLDPKAKAEAVVDFFKKAGCSPNDLLHLAAAIKKDLKNGKLKMTNENRIAISLKDLQNYLHKIKHSQTPPEMRSERRQLSEKNPIENTGQAEATVKPKTLKFHPEVPKKPKPSVEQCAGNLTTLLALFPQGKELISQALQEQQLLGATA